MSRAGSWNDGAEIMVRMLVACRNVFERDDPFVGFSSTIASVIGHDHVVPWP